MSKAVNVALARTVRAAVIRNGIQGVFASHLSRAGRTAQKLVIASPWITGDSQGGTLSRIARIIKRRGIATYVFTRPPKTEAHRSALNALAACPSVELVFNENLHAKVYACLAPYPYGFGMLGSANLTSHSEELHEIGLVVLSGGGGDEIVKELAAFGLDYLRTRPDSQIIKRLSIRR
jgi:hypothetical protein